MPLDFVVFSDLPLLNCMGTRPYHFSNTKKAFKLLTVLLSL